MEGEIMSSSSVLEQGMNDRPLDYGPGPVRLLEVILTAVSGTLTADSPRSFVKK